MLPLKECKYKASEIYKKLFFAFILMPHLLIFICNLSDVITLVDALMK